MKRALFVTITSLLLMISSGAENVKPMKAIAIINGPNGVYGNVTFSQSGCGESVLIELSIIGLSPGEHGFHIHEKGDLSNGCLSTGGHYNPDKMDHGAPNDQVRHIGDLGNIKANDNGIAETKYSDQVISMYGHRSIIGRAVVVHNGVDDFGKSGHPDSKKTGNAGGRAGCGVIGILDPSSGEWPCSSATHLTISSIFVVAIFASMFINSV